MLNKVTEIKDINKVYVQVFPEVIYLYYRRANKYYRKRFDSSKNGFSRGFSHSIVSYCSDFQTSVILPEVSSYEFDTMKEAKQFIDKILLTFKLSS